jgi:GNAT superfamily N-acetyltransferase
VNSEPSFLLAAEPDAVPLLQFMREYYAFDGHTFDEQKSSTALITLLRDPALGRVWLVQDGDVPVGYAVLCFGYSLEWLGRDAFVDELFLREEYRGRGWGSKTMAFVEDAARALNIRTLHLEVVRQNTAALRVYSKLGFRERGSTLMSKLIAQDFSKPASPNGH